MPAEANEADAVDATEADEADEAKATDADEAYEAKATEADEAKATDEADEAKADESDKAKANEAGEAIAVDRTIAVDRANMANKANEASLAEANESLANGSIAVVVIYLGRLLTLLPFSLTKYSAIFAEVKGHFRISGTFRLDNQLGWADKVTGVADTADELNKLDGADEADVIVRVNKIVVVNEAIWFCCMFSLRMQYQF
jgi:hypothetical protein